MNVVPGPGLFSDPGFAPVVKGLQAFKYSLAAKITGDEFFKFLFDDGIDGGLPLGGQLAGLFQEFIVNFQGDIGHS
jgi:hypothetical protein